jgi:hypothetical protein
MSGFSADWLALREPYDTRARNPAVLDAVVEAFAGKSSLDIVDLACGAGSTVRALAPKLPARQNWRLIDDDADLLARAANTTSLANGTIQTFAVDLNRNLEDALGGKGDLIATSALLDLVSEKWLDRLARAATARSVPVYAALSYDGRIEIAPADAFDVAIVAAVNHHQRRDKGFGPALGPFAADAAITRFESAGFSVVQRKSDWVAGPQDAEFQTEILRGWANAAKELGTLSASDIDAWLKRRLEAISDGRSTLRVGHIDFLARPIGTR